MIYNLGATIKNVESLSQVNSVMLECFDPKDTDPAISFNMATGDLRSNPNPFYRGLNEYFLGRGISPEFAYSTSEFKGIQVNEEDIVDHEGSVNELLDKKAKEWSRRVDPVILERVLQKRPELIIIGSAHANFLCDKLEVSDYMVIEDTVTAQKYEEDLFRKLADQLKETRGEK